MLDSCIQLREQGEQHFNLLRGIYLEQIPQLRLVLGKLPLKEHLYFRSRTNAERPGVLLTLLDGNEPFPFQRMGQFFNVLPGTPQHLPQLCQSHRPFPLPNH